MNLKHQAFITEYLRHRDAYTAYCFAYNVQDCSKYETIMSAANRLMNREDVGGTIKSILEGIRSDVEQEIRAELKTELLTVQRKRELLAKIATGEMYVMQYYKGKDCNHCSQHVAPTINQMLKAIDLDSRLAGHYPETKHHSKQNTTNNNKQSPLLGEPVPQQREVRAGLTHESAIINTPLLNQESLSRNGGRTLHDLPLAGSSATGAASAEGVEVSTKHFPSSEGLGVGNSRKAQQPEHPNKTIKHDTPLLNKESLSRNGGR